MKCGNFLDNDYLTWCHPIIEEGDFRYMGILNGDLKDNLKIHLDRYKGMSSGKRKGGKRN